MQLREIIVIQVASEHHHQHLRQVVPVVDLQALEVLLKALGLLTCHELVGGVLVGYHL